ncbi:MFS transporter [Azoarcus sp. DN11]|uniref:spinster family MFS transporter n=1 Tax=Azoarcus sp. DN11 TaxID=356837 RepID=UPI000EAD4692|nr:MFS transporter [Azoarcus sp. DN11]AYH45085.1 MFS transporter [Azoarcus sp. DN11]
MISAGQRRYVLFLLFMVSVFNYIDRTILSILQVPIKADLGLSDSQLGALTGLSFALFYSTLSLPIARLADRWTRKYLIAGSLAIWSGMTSLTGLATSFTSLLFYRVGVAAGEAGSIPATHSMIADLYPASARATALSVWGLSLPVGMMFGFSIAGALADAVGWRMAFAVVGVAGLVLVPILTFTMREPKRGQFDLAPATALPAPSAREALSRLWGLKTYRYLVVAGAFHAFAWYSVNSWSAPFYVRVHEMSLAQTSLYLALVNGFGSAAGMYLGGRLSDHFGKNDPRARARVVAIALFVMVPFALCQYFVASAEVSMALGAVSQTLMLVYYGPIIAIAHMLVPANMRAFTSAVLMLVLNLFGLGLGPFVTGLLSDTLVAHMGMAEHSLRYAISFSVLFSLMGGWMFWRASNSLPHEMLHKSEKSSPEPVVPAGLREVREARVG